MVDIFPVLEGRVSFVENLNGKVVFYIYNPNSDNDEIYPSFYGKDLDLELGQNVRVKFLPWSSRTFKRRIKYMKALYVEEI